MVGLRRSGGPADHPACPHPECTIVNGYSLGPGLPSGVPQGRSPHETDQDQPTRRDQAQPERHRQRGWRQAPTEPHGRLRA